MSHQSEIEKEKYRNWVKGGLAYKYLKQGLDDFADDVVKQEQNRILSSINRTPGTISICNQCIIERLRPLHACRTNSEGKYECPWGQRKCNCLHLNKKKCRLKVCDFIMEDILKSHGSTPPTPNWANTDIQKWCTEPWEVAKCFINAPGYSDKTKAADIDISGLLHVFINNTNLHSHLACSMTRKNIFIKVRERRNKLFHSASMETEEGEVAECIDDIVEILEDPKEIRGRPEAQEAVNKLKQLKESKFVITTNDEADVCKEAIMCVTQKAEELKQMIEEVKDFNERVQNNETNMSEKVEELTKDLYKRIEKVESDVFVLKSDVSAVKERVTSLECTVRELDSKRDIYKRHLDYVKWKQEQYEECLLSLFQNKDYNEYNVQVILAAHLFGPLAGGYKIGNKGFPKDARRCPNCGKDISGKLKNISLGHGDVWHGHADIFVKGSVVKVVSEEDDSDEEDGSSEQLQKKMRTESIEDDESSESGEDYDSSVE